MREVEYILETPLGYRKDYGQFFTPSVVARFMAEWVMADDPSSILDPAFGLGIFYDEIKRIKPNSNFQFTGYEIDPRILDFVGLNGRERNLKIINDDYLQAERASYDAIICNPPYMRFQKFITRHDVLPKIEQQIGQNLVGYSNIASVFLVKALNELKRNGRLAFIMPFEFFNAGYGENIKKTLLEKFLLKQIIIFANEKDIFPDVTTTVCVLLCQNDGHADAIKITRIANNEEINQISSIGDFYQFQINSSDLPYDSKWTPIISAFFSQNQLPVDFCQLSFYGAFTRGIATGANDFFGLRKSTIEGWNLPEDNLCKCLTKSQQVKTAIFTEEDFLRLYYADQPVYCLDVKDRKNPQIINYLKTGEKLGYHQRYLTKTRSHWYKIERRNPAPILFGVFSRGRLKVIRNLTTAINFTCFHCFYPNIFGDTLINKLFVYLLSDMGQNILKANKRSYGGNLDKFEPGDLNDSLCPNQTQFALIDEREALGVIELAAMDEKLAIDASNLLMERIFPFP